MVWLAATAAAATAGWLAAPAALTLRQPATWQGSFEDLLVAVCATVLLACGLRLWLVTSVTAVALARGRAPRASRGLTHRLVLAACGAAVVAGVSTPAVAGQGGDLQRLAGLPMPDRATAGSSLPAVAPLPAQSSAQSSTEDVVVRSGDSLWSLASARLPGTARPADVERAWRAVYAANRAEIGPDPGLIHPGQRLQLPEVAGEGDDR